MILENVVSRSTSKKRAKIMKRQKRGVCVGGSSGAGYNFEGFPSICTFLPPRFQKHLVVGCHKAAFPLVFLFSFSFFPKGKNEGGKGAGGGCVFHRQGFVGGKPQISCTFLQENKGGSNKKNQGERRRRRERSNFHLKLRSALCVGSVVLVPSLLLFFSGRVVRPAVFSPWNAGKEEKEGLRPWLLFVCRKTPLFVLTEGVSYLVDLA